uniref:Cadherin domain-containing protein n=1 Tax=Monodelphis domestica TaxID=13616 RepID=A0A5F8GZ62_MONDO
MMFSCQNRLRSHLLLFSLLLHIAWEVGSGQVHYSLQEEARHGTFVGRIAQDLGLEVGELVSRLFRVVSKGRTDYLEVNVQNGILFVNSWIDREELCGRSPVCSIHLEVIVDKPLQVFHVEVEIKDVNDNPPVFPTKSKNLFFSESRPLDSTFPLEGASDADTGTNALLSYRLSPNEYFSLDVQTNEELSQSLSLVLRKPLDREETSRVNLLLIATDGGKPELTGTVHLLIKVLDVNDNEPVFDQSLYKVRLLENTANGTLVIKLNASDSDEGSNSEVIYSFSSDVPSTVQNKFKIDARTGEIRIKGQLDYEEAKSYEIQVIASDKGTPSMSGHCKVSLKVLDINDNAPEVFITSLSLPVREDASPGTVIALISVSDRDSGANGQVTCSLSPQGSFTLVSTFRNYYSLVLEGLLDRESVPAYELVVTARDGGTPALWAETSLSVGIYDVNDNAPVFEQPEYTVFVKENNPPGCHIFTVLASDTDALENSLVSYSLVDRQVGERLLSSYVSVHSESGKVYALQPLDHEELELLQFQVSARDAGFPPLASNVSLQVFVLDENDNAPAVLPPHAGISSVSELVSQSVAAGHVVAKIRAVDADSGYNAWLSYELQPEVGVSRSPFRVGLYTGEISTIRALEESDGPRQTLLVLVKDHGEPLLSATATVILSLVESGLSVKASSGIARQSEVVDMSKENVLGDVNVYLIIAICAVSSLLVLSLLLYVALKYSTPFRAVYSPGKPTLVCTSGMNSWSYSQKRGQRICSGDGIFKNDLMAFSPNLPSCPSSEDRSPQPELGSAPSCKQNNSPSKMSATTAEIHFSVAAAVGTGRNVKKAKEEGSTGSPGPPQKYQSDSL